MKLLLTFLLCLSVTEANAGDISVSVAEVKDTRTTGQFFGEMEIKLKVIGDILSDAKGVRVKATKAVDETGRNLLKDEVEKVDFTRPDENNVGQAEVRIKLKNPARKATVINELSGDIDIYVPKNDPNSTAKIKDFITQTGKVLTDPALRAAQVDVTVLTKKQYEEVKARKEKEAKDSSASKLGDAFAQAFGALFGSLASVGENDIILSIKDPGTKVIAIEFQDESGKRIKEMGSMTMGEVRVFKFNGPVGQKAQMAIFIGTPKSLRGMVFRAKEVALP